MTSLRCPGVGRDIENERTLVLYFNRPITDDEMRQIHDAVRMALPKLYEYTDQSCPGHVASDNDNKICERCGIYIDDLRPVEE